MYVVTGGAGFIGSNLVAALHQEGVEPVAVIDRLDNPHKKKNIAKHPISHLIEPEDTFSFLDKHRTTIKMLFHLGAISSTVSRDLERLRAVNVDLGCSLWHWCTHNKVPFIYASSAAIYGDGSWGFDDDCASETLSKFRPLNAYGCSKQKFDFFVAEASESGAKTPPQWAGLRFFNVYGPNEFHKGYQASVANHIYSVAARGEPFALFRSHHAAYPDGGQMRDFVYVSDCIDVMLWLLKDGKKTGFFNVGTGKARTFIDLASAVYCALNLSPMITFKDTPDDIRSQYQYFTKANIQRLRKAGYNRPFRSLETGIHEYVCRYLSQTDPYS